MTLHVFVGPTLSAPEIQREVPEACIHPPVSHGDLLGILFRPYDSALIIDGYYHQTGSVRHKEILELLASEVRVAGSASMGAIRAAELDIFGMIGLGRIYEMYKTGIIDGDDEVAVAHGEDSDYRPVSVPVVNVRHSLSAAAANGVISDTQAYLILECARSIPYTQRSWSAIGQACRSSHLELTSALKSVRHFISANPHHGDLKRMDAIQSLREFHAWGAKPIKTGDWAKSYNWQNKYLRSWRPQFKVAGVDGTQISEADVCRYQQLYDPDFPERWRNFVIRQIAGSSECVVTGDSDRRRALYVAASRGISSEFLTPSQKSEWITPTELDNLSDEDVVLKILVRSYRHPPETVAGAINETEFLSSVSRTRVAVAEACEINEKMVQQGRYRHIVHLKVAKLRAHLGNAWGVDHLDERHFKAAARDRGFSTINAATDAARTFYLSHLLKSERSEEMSTPNAGE